MPARKRLTGPLLILLTAAGCAGHAPASSFAASDAAAEQSSFPDGNGFTCRYEGRVRVCENADNHVHYRVL